MVAIRSSAVARLSVDLIVAPPIQVSRSFGSRRSHPRQQGPQQPTRSGRSLFPATPMIPAQLSPLAIAADERSTPPLTASPGLSFSLDTARPTHLGLYD